MFALVLILACDADPDGEAACALTTDILVETSDQATIALHHHPGRGAPVLLVHGVSSNARFWDLDAEHSLAAWLVGEGFDPWLLDLRGHGRARRHVDGAPQLSGWTVDHYGTADVAAAVAHVRAVTGYRKVGYVGHSMGGMVGAIYVASGHDDLSAMVMVGSPATFDRDAPLVESARVAMGIAGASMFWIEAGVGGELAAALGTRSPVQLQRHLYNAEHFEPLTERRMLRTITSPLSRQEMQHFARMLTRERFESADGSLDWTTEYRRVAPPTLAISGSRDEVGLSAIVAPWTVGLPGPAKHLDIAEYGHLDLGLGEDAERDVFPHIAAWLSSYPPSSGGGRAAPGAR